MLDKQRFNQIRFRFLEWFHQPIARGWALLGFLILTIGISIAIQTQQSQNKDARQAIIDSGRAVSVYGCNRDYLTTEALRGILVASRKRTEDSRLSGSISNKRARESNAFLTQQLATLIRPDCREAVNIINDNPNHHVKIPTPLYDKDAAKRKRERQEAREAKRIADKVAAELRAQARARERLKKRIKARIRSRLRNR